MMLTPLWGVSHMATTGAWPTCVASINSKPVISMAADCFLCKSCAAAPTACQDVIPSQAEHVQCRVSFSCTFDKFTTPAGTVPELDGTICTAENA